MRTKTEIKDCIANKTDQLSRLINVSVLREQENENRCNEIEAELESLKKETPFDDTLAGQAWFLTQETLKKIHALLDELEQKTGVKLDFKVKSRNGQRYGN